MTQEDKELLIKDLCLRLPYGVKCEVIKRDADGEMIFIRNNSHALELAVNNIKNLVTNNLYEIKPYLFPLSSMTEEQEQEYSYIVNYISPDDTENWKEGEFIYVEQVTQLLHFYLINHLDFRGLIPMGIALDATNKNIY